MHCFDGLLRDACWTTGDVPRENDDGDFAAIIEGDQIHCIRGDAYIRRCGSTVEPRVDGGDDSCFVDGGGMLCRGGLHGEDII